MSKLPIKVSELRRMAAVAKETQSTIEVEEDGRIIRVYPPNTDTYPEKKIKPIVGPLM